MSGIYIIGDSICLGYRDYIKRTLLGETSVYYPAENTRFSTYLLYYIREIKKQFEHADEIGIVCFNCGLWDVVRILGDDMLISMDQYKANLYKIVNRLKYVFPNAKLCFVTTTPVIEEQAESDWIRNNADIEAYNECAKDIMRKSCIDVIDIYDIALKLRNNHIDFTHFDDIGYQTLAELIVHKLRQMKETHNIKWDWDEKEEKKNMNTEYERFFAVKDSVRIVIWGTGRVMRRDIERINPTIKIDAFCDTDRKKWGTLIYKGLVCISPDELTENDAVLIAVADSKAIKEISEILDARSIRHCHIVEAADADRNRWEALEAKRAIEYYKEKSSDNVYDDEVVKFINCDVTYTNCNFRCDYCYVQQHITFMENRLNFHSPEFIRAAFSKVRLGGRCLIALCADGETLLCQDLLPIIAELVREGHYIHIVTNGTISSSFDKLLDYDIDFSRIFFKFSFHYLELLRTNKLNEFFNNIHKMENVGCSYTVEMVASDSLMPYIEDIKNCSLKEIGALPHLTVPRNDIDAKLQFLTKYDVNEYNKIWQQFDSSLFTFKVRLPEIEHIQDCMAGEKSYFVNLLTGDLLQCFKNPKIGNIYDDLCSELPAIPVRDNCCLPYCYNGHVMLALGISKNTKAPTYNEVRDRVTDRGKHWVKDKFKTVFEQKL